MTYLHLSIILKFFHNLNLSTLTLRSWFFLDYSPNELKGKTSQFLLAYRSKTYLTDTVRASLK